MSHTKIQASTTFYDNHQASLSLTPHSLILQMPDPVTVNETTGG